MSEAFRDRLRRLRREAGESAEPQPQVGPQADLQPDADLSGAEQDLPATPAGMPVWLRAKLGRGGAREGVLGGYGIGRPAARAPLTVGEPKRLAMHEGPLGTFAARTTRYAAEHVHGDWALAEVDHVEPADLALLSGDSQLAELSLRDVVYLDIETTGLSGGAGVFPFMIALGVFDDEGFELWQGFLRSPADEPALLAECARRISSRSGLVSFFGKSFDRHRLEDKMRVCGIAPPFAELPHLDLYHPLASLYKAAWPDARLSRTERELCGVMRKDDLSGAFAPEAWFDYLGERGHRLEAVFQHNLDDVLSLVTLAAHLGCVPREERRNGRGIAGPALSRAQGMARALERAGDREASLEWIGRALERAGRSTERPLLCQRADTLRLLGRHAEALEAYEQVRAAGCGDSWAIQAWLQSAKLLEHKLRDPAAALECCRTAARLLDEAARGSRAGGGLSAMGESARASVGWRDHTRLSADCKGRLARLERKVASSEQGAGAAEVE